MPGLPAAPCILDLGCGPGRQSLVLAEQSGGQVTAVDLQSAFLEEVEERAAQPSQAGPSAPAAQEMAPPSRLFISGRW